MKERTQTSAEMRKGRHVVIHVYGDTTKWATDQSAIRTWPCKYSMHQYSILLQILGNWLIDKRTCLYDNIKMLHNENSSRTK